MKMSSRIKILVVCTVLVLVSIVSTLFYSNREGFEGSRIKNPDYYLLDIKRMNGTDVHTLELEDGDTLQIQFQTVKGSLYMEIHAPDGTVIYRGDGKETTDFTVNIQEKGAYMIVVVARRAKGMIEIQCV